MNKASFDRAYKANKGLLLDPIVVVDEDGNIYDIDRVVQTNGKTLIMVTKKSSEE